MGSVRQQNTHCFAKQTFIIGILRQFIIAWGQLYSNIGFFSSEFFADRKQGWGVLYKSKNLLTLSFTISYNDNMKPHKPKLLFVTWVTNGIFKRFVCVLLFAFLINAVYADNVPDRNTLFIEGTAPDNNTLEFFMDNFTMEATSLLFTVTDTREEARWTLRFTVTPNMAEDLDPAGEPQYMIAINFIRNADDVEIVMFTFAYDDLFDMFAHNQFLVFMAIINVPYEEADDGLDDSELQELLRELSELRELRELMDDSCGLEDSELHELLRELLQEVMSEMREQELRELRKLCKMQERELSELRELLDDSWRRQWLSLRFSADLPIRHYYRQGRGRERLNPGAFPSEDGRHYLLIDNRLIRMPGATLGLEMQLLEWLNIEANIQMSMGEPHYGGSGAAHLAAGLEVKFPLRFIHGVKITPFAAFSYYFLRINSNIYDYFPPFAVGGGLQLGMRGFSSGSFFINISYMRNIPNASVYFMDTIHYYRMNFVRDVIRIGVGYKFGLVRNAPWSRR